MNEPKISESAKTTVLTLHCGIEENGCQTARDEAIVQKAIDTAVMEACEPLATALEELCNRVDNWDAAIESILGRRSNDNMSTASAVCSRSLSPSVSSTMKLFILLLSCLTAAAQESAVQRDAGLLREVCSTNRLVPLTRAQWANVNTARKAQSLPLFSYDVARTNEGVNGPYFITLLTMIETEIREPFVKANGRLPSTQEVLAAWAVGVPKFSKLRYDFSKIKDPAVQLLIVTFTKDKQILNLAQRPGAPPPLPEARTNIGPRGTLP